MIKNIIFDMDGVLAKSMELHITAWQKALFEKNIVISRHELALHEGEKQPFLLEELLGSHKIKISKEEMEKILKRKNEIFHGYNIKSYRIKRHLLKLKKKGIRLGVGTGSTKSYSKVFLDKNFKGIFDVCISGEDISKSKPNPETYLKAMKLLGGKRSDTLVIENAPLGIEAGKRAGLKVYALETTLPRKYLVKADKVFKYHEELFEYIFKTL